MNIEIFDEELRKGHKEGKGFIFPQEPPKIIDEDECVNTNCKLFTYELTDEMIEALKECKAISLDIDREYTALIWRKRKKEKARR